MNESEELYSDEKRESGMKSGPGCTAKRESLDRTTETRDPMFTRHEVTFTLCSPQKYKQGESIGVTLDEMVDHDDQLKVEVLRAICESWLDSSLNFFQRSPARNWSPRKIHQEGQTRPNL